MASLASRTRARELIERLDSCESVVGVDLIDPQADPSGEWTVSALCAGATVSPAVLRELGRAGAALRVSDTNAEWTRIVAVVS